MTPDWPTKSLEDLVDIRIGGTPSRAVPTFWEADKNLGHPWAAISDLKGRYLDKTKERITDDGVARSNVKLLPVGTVVMSFKLSIGRVAITTRPIYTNEAIAGFVPNDELDANYLFHALPLIALRADVDVAVKGATLNKAKLCDLMLPLPPLWEQKKIAAILTAVDEAIEATQAVIDQLQVVKSALMSELLTRGSDDANWPIVAVGSVCTSIVPGRTKPRVFDGSIPWLRIGDLEESTVRHSKEGLCVSRDELARCGGKVVPKNAVIMSCVGNFGVASRALEEVVLNQQLHAFVCGERVLAAYLVYALQHAGPQMLRRAGMTTIAYLNKAHCEATAIALPPMREQEKIAASLSAVDEAIAASNVTVEHQRGVKTGLAADLLSGRVRVTSELANA